MLIFIKKNSSYFTILVVLLFLITGCSSVNQTKSAGLIASKIDYGGTCILIEKKKVEKPDPDESGAESVPLALGGILIDAVVGETFTLITDSLKEYEESFSATDSASSMHPFYCYNQQKKLFGVRKQLTYTRNNVTLKDGSTSSDTLINIESNMDFYIEEKGSDFSGIFTLTPSKILYKTPIAKRGDTKDLTVTYSFEFFDEKKPVLIVLEPYVFKSIKAGSEYQNLENFYGARLVGKLPKNISTKKVGSESNFSAPFKVKIDVVESPVGKGEIVAAKILKNMGESLSKEKTNILDSLKKYLDDEAEEFPEEAPGE